MVTARGIMVEARPPERGEGEEMFHVEHELPKGGDEC